MKTRLKYVMLEIKTLYLIRTSLLYCIGNWCNWWYDGVSVVCMLV